MSALRYDGATEKISDWFQIDAGTTDCKVPAIDNNVFNQQSDAPSQTRQDEDADELATWNCSTTSR